MLPLSLGRRGLGQTISVAVAASLAKPVAATNPKEYAITISMNYVPFFLTIMTFFGLGLLCLWAMKTKILVSPKSDDLNTDGEDVLASLKVPLKTRVVEDSYTLFWNTWVKQQLKTYHLDDLVICCRLLLGESPGKPTLKLCYEFLAACRTTKDEDLFKLRKMIEAGKVTVDKLSVGAFVLDGVLYTVLADIEAFD